MDSLKAARFLVLILTVNHHIVLNVFAQDSYTRTVEYGLRRLYQKPDGERVALYDSMVDAFKEDFSVKGELFNTFKKYPTTLESTSGLQADRPQQVNFGCLKDFLQILDCFERGEEWAQMFIDAFGKPPPGIMEGNLMWMGSYNECRKAKGLRYKDLEHRKKPDGYITGKYCSAALPVNQTAGDDVTPISLPSMKFYQFDSLNLGICAPNTCSEYDIEVIIDQLYGRLSRRYPVLGNTTLKREVFCKPDEYHFDTKALIVIFICSLYAGFLALATAYDFYSVWVEEQEAERCKSSYDDPNEVQQNGISHDTKTEKLPLVQKDTSYDSRKRKSLLAKVLRCFSVYESTKKLLSVSEDPGPLSAVNGIRFISMTWVILGHSYVFALIIRSEVPNTTEYFYTRWTAQVVLNGLLSVDSFFAISGFLMTYFLMNEMKAKKGKINWAFFYFHRFWRISPPYFMVLMIYVVLFKYAGEGPLWPHEGQEVGDCKDTWWYNVLFINNFPESLDTQCMTWAWYLATDIQFFVVSPFILYPLYHFEKIGLVVMGIVLVAVWVASWIVSVIYNLNVSMLVIDESNPVHGFDTYFFKYYLKPYCRMGPYIIGMLTGFILYKLKGKCKIKKVVNVFGWIIAAVSALSVVYGSYDTLSGKYVSRFAANLYNSISKTVWGAAISWVVFSCGTGHGGYINTFLSWKPFLPFSRLTFSAYLVHPIIMMELNLSRRNMLYYTDQLAVTLFLANLVLSYMCAFVISVAFESPMMALEKVFLKKGKKK